MSPIPVHSSGTSLTGRSSGRQHWPRLRHFHGQCWCPRHLRCRLPWALARNINEYHGMKNRITALVLILLSGCANNVWVGGNPDGDMYECKLEAVRQYPPVLYYKQVGAGYTSPSHTSCNAIGGFITCNTTGGNYTPPPTITSDANSSTRDSYVNYCMIQRGNRLVSESDYKNIKQYESNEETPTQRRIRLREQCRSDYGQNSPLCENKGYLNSSISSPEPEETPTQKRIRLREECRKINGENSPLC
jgi:hypothetical protein